MVSDSAATIFILSLAIIILFIIWSIHSPKQRYLLNRLYIWMLLAYAVWALCMLGMWITPRDRADILQTLDALTYIGISIAGFYLMIAIVFVKGYDRLPKWCLLFLVIPLLSVVVCLTNNWHHLQYQQFSVIRRD